MLQLGRGKEKDEQLIEIKITQIDVDPDSLKRRYGGHGIAQQTHTHIGADNVSSLMA